ncbi:hypothetical protein SLNWT_5134 [Streptomyces albus]|uniref:Uncharacterized protein n=1 Tax=Streptomyces albus (strain ATCC 21838 / DSM 41398 / FERM P-419 / JCM 4703 / NBRC 107858) TaxID=1081613 RepID=A0A0B5F1P5_STRA4|nr:hypothetical protein SLNWT_5134 [Streptomyces albus]AOU79813.1 hypothetical protein SLNHY_5122 [Streptomyces albus]AYN35537.1 hypothetical protein DUI70_5039 [Streptomyces albus]
MIPRPGSGSAGLRAERLVLAGQLGSDGGAAVRFRGGPV